LRGGNDSPNYSPDDLSLTTELLKKNGLPPSIMVDCSHANSYKDHNRQEEVLNNIVDQIIAGATNIGGVMIESNLYAGNQEIPKDLSQLLYGVSVTDKCVDWETTEKMLIETHKRLLR
jgi:3-deoxy-7-phosphoheptulonate synthase